MRKWLKRLAILVALALVVVLLKATFLTTDPVVVDVYTVEPGRVEETVTNSRAGTVRARRRAKLSPEFGGTVVAIPFREGERVKKGDVLLRLDDTLQQAELDLAERELNAALAQRKQASLAAERAARELKRISRLAEEEIASSDWLDQAQTEAERSTAACEAAGANVERAQAAQELTRRRLEKVVLRAPFDAVVADLATEVGEWVTPSPPGLPIPPVVDVLDPGSIYISAPMDEVDSARISAEQPARVTVDSYPGKHFPGRVSRVAPYVLDIEAQNRTVEIEVELDAPEVVARLLPGTSADVEIILVERHGVLRVPTLALMEENQVLVIEGGRLVTREVQIGLRNWDYTEILEGLRVGEEVVTSLDRPEVQPGAKVVVKEKGGSEQQ
jgi:HlyD family secretion protein